jgi:hypothetical protein
VDIRFDDRAAFAQLAKKFRAAGKGGAAIRKALTATIQKELKSVVTDIQTEARSMSIRGVRNPGSRVRLTSSGRGSQARERFDAAKEMRRAAKAMAKGKKVRARHRGGLSTGLRERVAHSVKSRVQYTGFRLGAKVYVDGSNFPGSQRKLPRHLNNPAGWRHPVWGNRDRWAREVGEPYFDRPIGRHRDRVRKNVAVAVNNVMRTLK